MDNRLTAVVFTGGECDTDRLDPSEYAGELIIAADSGYRTALKCGVIPHIIAGDFDSAPIPEIADAEIIRVPAEKDDTDTMLACDLAIGRGASVIRILGGTGGRMDHSLSNLFLLENLHRRGVTASLCDGQNRICVLENGSRLLSRCGYRYFSLIALEDACVTLTGCKYPLSDAPLTRSLPYAVSNEITAENACVTVSGGPVFLIESEKEP